MLIQLSPAVTHTVTTAKVEVVSVTDRSDAKTVTADVSIESVGPRILVLWEGDAYDAIGQWTDDNVRDRVREMVGLILAQ